MGIQYKIDTLSGDGGRLHVAGWAISDQHKPITWTLSTRGGGAVQSAKYYPVQRPDISRLFFHTTDYADCGFEIDANIEEERAVILKLSDGNRTISVRLSPGGMRNRIKKLRRGVRHYRENYAYQKWFRKNRAGRKELAAQANGPLISVVVPVYRTPLPFLREMVNSVRRQSYGNWQLCLSNSGARGGALEEYLKKLAAQDDRIVVAEETGQLGISENTNRALELATGAYIGFLDHDDVLEPDALYAVAKAAARNPEAECFYTDEDKVTVDGKVFYEPHFKPDFDRFLLLTNNYISHFFVISRRRMEQAQLRLRDSMDGSQDYDFVLRATRELKPGQVVHIPRVLYHWRSHPGSTAAARDAKNYTAEAGLRALTDYCRKSAEAYPEAAEQEGYYRLRLLEPEQMPDVSVIFRNVTSLQEVPQLEQTAAAWGNGRIEVVIETPVGLNRVPRGEWLFFADADWAGELGPAYRKMAAVMQMEGVGAVTGRCVDADGMIRSAGVHLENRKEGRMAVSSFDGLFDERISYGNLTRLRRRVYGAMPVFLMIDRALYAQAGSPVSSRLAPAQVLAAAADIGAAAQAAAKAVVYEPEAVIRVKEWPWPQETVLDISHAGRDPYLPRPIRQRENGDWSVRLE